MTLGQFGVALPIVADDDLRHLGGERTGDAQFVAAAHRPANQAAADVALLDVARRDAIGNHKGGRAQVVGDDAREALLLLRRERRLARSGAGRECARQWA